jgi:plastocyanin
MVAARALVCALALLLVGAATASASAAPGAWPKTKAIKRLHFETKPIVVKPGQNSIDNVFIPKDQRPAVDGYIVRMKPDLQFLNSKVPPVDVIHLHHGVWLNVSGTSPAAPIGNVQPIFFGGEEKTVFRIPRGYGYAYKKTDSWLLNQMIHNNTPNRTLVKLVWDLDFIPASSALAKKVKPVVPMWMDVRRGWGYPVFDVIRGRQGSDGNGSFTFPDDASPDPYAGGSIQNEYTMPFDGTVVSAVGHLHPGGLRDDIDVVRKGATLPAGSACRRVATDALGARTTRRCVRAQAGTVGDSVRVFRSQAKYYDPAGPVSWDVSLTASRPDWRVLLRRGDTVRITATYEDRKSSWYENMGIVLLFVAPGDKTGLDPFAKPVDWRGVLTHGHLRENDNHGGKKAVLPDARKAADGPVTAEVKINGFQFQPGDLGLLFDDPTVPVVPQGQSLSFVNQDDPAVEWHSITTCRAPCNRQTGISYPLANGALGTQFDSGQLGFGPVGASPAANRLTWQTPSDLPQGTYTYFCRIHPFMRGAFRVQ